MIKTNRKFNAEKSSFDTYLYFLNHCESIPRYQIYSEKNSLTFANIEQRLRRRILGASPPKFCPPNPKILGGRFTKERQYWGGAMPPLPPLIFAPEHGDPTFGGLRPPKVGVLPPPPSRKKIWEMARKDRREQGFHCCGPDLLREDFCTFAYLLLTKQIQDFKPGTNLFGLETGTWKLNCRKRIFHKLDLVFFLPNGKIINGDLVT